MYLQYFVCFFARGFSLLEQKLKVKKADAQTRSKTAWKTRPPGLKREDYLSSLSHVHQGTQKHKAGKRPDYQHQ